MSGKVLLIAMPWAQYYMASIQISALKSYLRSHSIEAEAGHWFVEVAHALGFDAYSDLCYPFLDDGESLYSYLVFPEMRKRLLSSEYLQDKIHGTRQNKQSPEDPLQLRLSRDFFKEFHQLHQDILERYDWSQYSLVGLTLNFGQTVASLYVAQEIKKRNPRCKVIIGGSEASKQLGVSLLENFPAFDYACNGEGERPLLHLAQALARGASPEEISTIKGLIARAPDGKVVLNPPDQLEAMQSLPAPDFDEYFETIDRLPGVSRDEVTACLPIEASRGCYYACSFCALNLQWQNFRSQPPARVAEMMAWLSSRYRLVDFFFVDNITPVNAEAIFSHVADQGLDYRFFYEIRTNLRRSALKEMKRAGLCRVQIGVESLSSSLLKKFNKKTRFIDNLQGMKNCEELQINTCGNLIVDHPRSTEEDIDETLQNMEFCLAYRPPNAFAPFVLEVGAPDYENRDEQLLRVKGNHRDYRLIYPPRLFSRLELLRKEYECVGPRADWARIKGPYDRWVQLYQENTRRLGENSRHLAYYDGGTFLRIEDHRSGAQRIHTFEGIERELYLAADEIQHLGQLERAFQDRIDAQQLREIVERFVELKLMYVEEGRCLSLAMAPSPGRQARASRSQAQPEARPVPRRVVQAVP